jgi:hypothetical protein
MSDDSECVGEGGGRPQPTAPSRLTAQQLLRLDRELHRQLLEDSLAEAVDDEVDRVLLGEAALAQ